MNLEKIKNLMRENIQNLEPYSSAREEFSDVSGKILLDANENPFNFLGFSDNLKNSKKNLDLAHYPDPNQKKLRVKISEVFDFKNNNLSLENIICGNGSDELIDLLVRIFCEPKKDKISICPPTFGMYKVAANISEIKVEEIPLIETENNFELDVENILKSSAKILFIPNPAAPTGGIFSQKNLFEIIKNFKGIVVVDEAYVDFSDEKSFISEIKNFSNLIILQTFSKYWGMAGTRVGMCFGNEIIIDKIRAIKAPYNVNVFSQKKAIEALENKVELEKEKNILVSEKEILFEFLKSQKFVKKIFKSDTNFIFFETNFQEIIYKSCIEENIIIRNFNYKGRSFLRISVGKPEQNEKLKKVLEKIN